jgi:hypothetical protein
LDNEFWVKGEGGGAEGLEGWDKGGSKMHTKTIEEKINNIGKKIVSCPLKCDGITKNMKEGKLPRCLIFKSGGHFKKGAIVVGINPGESNKDECNEYKKNGTSYKSVKSYWEREISKRPYYTQISDLLGKLSLTGPILWTELAKCEGTQLPLQTFRTCTNKYLLKEIVAYLYSDRTVIGIPHPTGSWGQFSKLLNSRKLLNIIKSILKRSHGEAHWVSVDHRKLI